MLRLGGASAGAFPRILGKSVGVAGVRSEGSASRVAIVLSTTQNQDMRET